jgi:hypothetical protein
LANDPRRIKRAASAEQAEIDTLSLA